MRSHDVFTLNGITKSSCCQVEQPLRNQMPNNPAASIGNISARFLNADIFSYYKARLKHRNILLMATNGENTELRRIIIFIKSIIMDHIIVKIDCNTDSILQIFVPTFVSLNY